jgi:hypothetical protein
VQVYAYPEMTEPGEEMPREMPDAIDGTHSHAQDGAESPPQLGSSRSTALRKLFGCSPSQQRVPETRCGLPATDGVAFRSILSLSLSLSLHSLSLTHAHPALLQHPGLVWYSDAKVANRDASPRVWHGAAENGLERGTNLKLSRRTCTCE